MGKMVMGNAWTIERVETMTPCTACPLRSLPIFRCNTEQEIAFIESMRSDQVVARAGQTIVEEGAADSPLFSLFDGWAFRYKSLPDDRRQILNFLVPGDVIGFQANMLGDVAHGVEALTDVILCQHSRSRIWELYRNHPELAFDTTWLTAKEEWLIDEVLLSVGRRSAAERIAMLIIHLFKRSRSLLPEASGVVPLPVTQQHIADALGLSLVHTNKTIRRLQAHGYFAMDRQLLHMRDLRGLEAVAKYRESATRPRPLI